MYLKNGGSLECICRLFATTILLFGSTCFNFILELLTLEGYRSQKVAYDDLCLFNIQAKNIE